MQISYTKRDKTTRLIPVLKRWFNIVLFGQALLKLATLLWVQKWWSGHGQNLFSLYFCRRFHYFFQIYSHRLACMCKNTNMIQFTFIVDALALWWSHEPVLIELSILIVISKPDMTIWIIIQGPRTNTLVTQHV